MKNDTQGDFLHYGMYDIESNSIYLHMVHYLGGKILMNFIFYEYIIRDTSTNLVEHLPNQYVSV